MAFPPPRGFRICRQGWSLGAGWTSDLSAVVEIMLGLSPTPNISAVSVQVTTFEGLLDRQSIDDRATSSIHQPGPLLHLGDELLVEQALGLLVQRAVLQGQPTAKRMVYKTYDCDHITLGHQVLELVDPPSVDALGRVLRSANM